jgi:hypothetical protein
MRAKKSVDRRPRILGKSKPNRAKLSPAVCQEAQLDCIMPAEDDKASASLAHQPF